MLITIAGSVRAALAHAVLARVDRGRPGGRPGDAGRPAASSRTPCASAPATTTSTTQRALARMIWRDHVACIAAIAAFLALQLW